MKTIKIFLFTVSALQLMSPSLWSQTLLEVEGQLTIDTAIDAHDNVIANVGDPLSPKDAATKAYVDQAVLNFALATIIDTTKTLQGLLSAGVEPVAILNAGIPSSYLIGLHHAGGIIFYMDPSENGTGLVSAEENEPGQGIQWGCLGIEITGADSTGIGTGDQNTIDIEAACDTIAIAADLCANSTRNGFSDWFLPSKDELNEMYTNIGQGAAAPNTNIGNFGGMFYWSSSEVDMDNAWGQNFGSGGQFLGNKAGTGRVRAIRAF